MSQIKGSIPWNKGKKGLQTAWNKGLKTGPQSEEVKRKRVEIQTKIMSDPIRRKNQSNKMKGINHPLFGKKRSNNTKDKIRSKLIGKCYLTEKFIENLRKEMLDGRASYMNSFISNPSKPQIELFNLVKSLCYCSIINYPIKEVNRCIDIAIPFHKIAIEYDGSYWHQDKEADNDRQNQLESYGWKFLRYLDVIPTKEQLKKDIESIIGD